MLPGTEKTAPTGWRAWAAAGTTWVRDRGAQVAVLVGVALVLIGLAAFIAVVDSVQEGDDLARLDKPVLDGLAAARSAPLTALFTGITTVSGPVVLPIVVLLGALAWGVFRREWWQAGLLAAAMILSTAVSLAVKDVVARPRPPLDTMSVAGVETTYSFPSGHTIGAATLLLVVAYLAWVRRPRVRSLVLWTAVVVVGTGLVALSRLYLGYHFVTDVAASVTLAVADLGGVVVVDRRRAASAARRTAAAAKAPSTDAVA